MRLAVLAEASITPDQIELTLRPGACAAQRITVTTEAVPISALDIVFIIDVTSSMDGIIDEVTRSAEKITGDIRVLSPDTRFALVTLSDYAGGNDGLLSFLTGYGKPDDYPWRLDQAFTHDTVQLKQSLNAIELMNGGDDAESYLRALYETQFLDWRDGAQRLVLLFGDSYPHDPDPGRDAKEGTDDDLTPDAVVGQLAAANITVLSIYSAPMFQDFYLALAQGTNGQAFHLQDTTEAAQVIQELMGEALASIHTLTLEVGAADEDWFTWMPASHTDVVSAEQREFTVEICAPTDTASGDYSFVVDVTGDGVALGQIPVLIHVRNTFNPLLLLIPALLLLLGSILLLWSRRRTVTEGTISPPPPRSGPSTSSRGTPEPSPRNRGTDIQHG